MKMAEALALGCGGVDFSAHDGALMAQESVALYPCGLNPQPPEQISKGAPYCSGARTTRTGNSDYGMLS
ncbi:hypothetical protein TPL01_26100 [Sulfuriferula plumbiphila]|uniref:Uncharacterized protein n=1 Tax=Sulfuriferula plumbiphila TaxID=171865 RepID=A0A512LAI8_9PROT|nr:hypothetical protein SFPGR_23830 [Sulfuriferula plumbiphila]GEP31472.1 hypothetical protein TPL01_26100 [Sulfuriferula plumbiphila]